MQSIIIAKNPLDSNSLHEALKRTNIDSLCVRPKALDGWQADTDAIILLCEIESDYFDIFADFFLELPPYTPLLFLKPINPIFAKAFPEILKRAIYINQNLHLEDLTDLVYETINQASEGTFEEIICGPISINRRIRKVNIEGSNLELTKKEFHLMELLAKNFGKITSRESIVEHVWSRRTYVSQNTIDVYVSRLRKKFPKSAKAPNIKTIPCLGYSLQLSPI